MIQARSDQASLVHGKRIAIVNWRDPWHPQAGGAETYAWEMARGLARRGARVHFLTARAPGQKERERRDGIEVRRMGGRFTVYPRVFAWLSGHRRSFDAVIDCQNGIPFFTPLVLPAAVPVLCVMHHVHDAQFRVHFSPVMSAIGRLLEGPVARWCYRRHECVAVSASTSTAMRNRLRWSGPIHVIPNGLSAECFIAADGADPDARPREAGAVSLVMVGRLVAHKRVERVLDIADRLGAGITIDVVGRGPQAGPLGQQIARRGLGGVVRLRGYLADGHKRAIVADAALHLNTSQGEGWGLCVLEAAALGVPTVAYDVDGLRDAICDGETGWLVKTGESIADVTELALKELANPARKAEIARACRTWAARFDWDASVGQMASLIESATQRLSPGRTSRRV